MKKWSKTGKRGKNQEKEGQNREKEEKSGREGKNREGSFTLPLLTDRGLVMLLGESSNTLLCVSLLWGLRRDYVQTPETLLVTSQAGGKGLIMLMRRYVLGFNFKAGMRNLCFTIHAKMLT